MRAREARIAFRHLENEIHFHHAQGITKGLKLLGSPVFLAILAAILSELSVLRFCLTTIEDQQLLTAKVAKKIR
jgi:hypothetical protein